MGRSWSGYRQSTEGLSCEHTERTAKIAVEAVVLVCPNLVRSEAFACRHSHLPDSDFHTSCGQGNLKLGLGEVMAKLLIAKPPCSVRHKQ